MKVDDEEKVPVAEYHPFKRHFLVFRMSRRAWLEVKPEAAAALEKIIGEYISWDECTDINDSSMVVDSELSHRRKAPTPSQDSHQVGARVNSCVRFIVCPSTPSHRSIRALYRSCCCGTQVSDIPASETGYCVSEAVHTSTPFWATDSTSSSTRVHILLQLFYYIFVSLQPYCPGY